MSKCSRRIDFIAENLSHNTGKLSGSYAWSHHMGFLDYECALPYLLYISRDLAQPQLDMCMQVQLRLARTRAILHGLTSN